MESISILLQYASARKEHLDLSVAAFEKRDGEFDRLDEDAVAVCIVDDEIYEQLGGAFAVQVTLQRTSKRLY